MSSFVLAAASKGWFCRAAHFAVRLPNTCYDLSSYDLIALRGESGRKAARLAWNSRNITAVNIGFIGDDWALQALVEFRATGKQFLQNTNRK